jgi:alpha-L-fucosidase
MDWDRGWRGSYRNLVNVSWLSYSQEFLTTFSGISNDGGDPTSPYYCPSIADTTLQTGDRWFYGVDQPLRSFEELVEVYHRTVGRNSLLELDVSPDRTGLVYASHAARYKQLGDFIKSCYGEPVNANNTQSSSKDDGSYTMSFSYPTTIDRVMLMEDQTNGQVIRSYEVFAKVVDIDDGATDGTLDVPWTKMGNGTSIGHKRIDMFDRAVTVTGILVNTTFVDTPQWRSVSVHLCDRLVANETGWELST